MAGQIGLRKRGQRPGGKIELHIRRAAVRLGELARPAGLTAPDVMSEPRLNSENEGATLSLPEFRLVHGSLFPLSTQGFQDRE